MSTSCITNQLLSFTGAERFIIPSSDLEEPRLKFRPRGRLSQDALKV
jgi:hypothetical protein